MTNQVSILTNKIKKLNADRDPRRCAQVTIGQPTLSSQGQLICLSIVWVTLFFLLLASLKSKNNRMVTSKADNSYRQIDILLQRKAVQCQKKQQLREGEETREQPIQLGSRGWFRLQKRNAGGKGGEKGKQIFMAFGREGLFLSKSSLDG